MISKASNLFKKHCERCIYMVVFAIAFAVIGYLIPEIYYHYVDRTVYFEIRQPVATAQVEYKKGASVSLIVNRRSYTDVGLHVTSEIIHINDDGSLVVKQLDYGHSPSTVAGESTGGEYVVFLTNSYKIPCDQKEGRTFIRSILEYEVRGVPKNYAFITDVFTVLPGSEPYCITE